MTAIRSTPVALTVAGSDSGGGAGIQADLKTFHSLGVFGATAITCVTAQNPGGVSAIQRVEPDIVAEQIDRVFDALPVRAAKIGMLFDAGIIEVVADAFRRRKFHALVIDPVMIATSGARLLKKDAIAALRTQLLPVGALVTPNLAETEVLWQRRVRTAGDLREAARALAGHFGVPFLVKGGHWPVGGRAVDVLCDGRELYEFRAAYIRDAKPHGAGCTYSAAIAAHLALGHDLVDSIRRAKRFVTRAIRGSLRVGKHRALNV